MERREQRLKGKDVNINLKNRIRQIFLVIEGTIKLPKYITCKMEVGILFFDF